MGKPKKRSPELEENILAAIRGGLPMRRAAALFLISEGTVRGWRDKDEDFAARVAQAEAQRMLLLVNEVKKKEQNWQAPMTLLERMHPDEWGRRQRIEQTGSGGGPVQIVLVDEVAVKREGT